MATEDIYGQLEIDIKRGVIYFHNMKGRTVLRVCRLKLPCWFDPAIDFIDVTHMVGCSTEQGRGAG